MGKHLFNFAVLLQLQVTSASHSMDGRHDKNEQFGIV